MTKQMRGKRSALVKTDVVGVYQDTAAGTTAVIGNY